LERLEFLLERDDLYVCQMRRRTPLSERDLDSTRLVLLFAGALLAVFYLVLDAFTAFGIS
jgi:hypothetical protein